eukprot:scaffold8316_cov149-Ochromonas_danica.AAC.1
MGGRMCTNAKGMGPVFLGAFLRSPPPLWLELSCSPRLSNGWWNAGAGIHRWGWVGVACGVPLL